MLRDLFYAASERYGEIIGSYALRWPFWFIDLCGREGLKKG